MTDKTIGHQTWWGSILEAKTNIIVGFTINYFANLIFLPLVGIHALTLGRDFELGVLFTFLSIARQLVIRRWFNRIKLGNRT